MIGGIFDFMRDLHTYEQRCVGRHKTEDLFISTARVSDGLKPFETLVRDARFEPDHCVVEAYDTREEAEIGHQEWVRKMTSEDFPREIEDCLNSKIANFLMDKIPPMKWKKNENH